MGSLAGGQGAAPLRPGEFRLDNGFAGMLWKFSKNS